MQIAIEIIGWAGAALILLAYALLSAGRLEARSRVYQLMNIGGAFGMTINGWVHHAYPSVATNVVWMAIGGTALFRILRARA